MAAKTTAQKQQSTKGIFGIRSKFYNSDWHQSELLVTLVFTKQTTVSLPTVMSSNGEVAPPATAVANLQPPLAIPANGGWVTFALRQGENERIDRLPITPNATPGTSGVN